MTFFDSKKIEREELRRLPKGAEDVLLGIAVLFTLIPLTNVDPPFTDLFVIVLLVTMVYFPMAQIYLAHRIYCISRKSSTYSSLGIQIVSIILMIVGIAMIINSDHDTKSQYSIYIFAMGIFLSLFLQNYFCVCELEIKNFSDILKILQGSGFSFIHNVLVFQIINIVLISFWFVMAFQNSIFRG